MQIFTDDSTSVDSIELDIIFDDIKKLILECWMNFNNIPRDIVVDQKLLKISFATKYSFKEMVQNSLREGDI